MIRAAGVPEAFLGTVVEAAAQEDWLRKIIDDTTWYHVFGKLAERLASREIQNAPLPWDRIHSMFAHLTQAGIPLLESYRAIIAYRAQQYGTAVELWDASGQAESEEYHRAKARLEPFPKNLTWFSKLKDHRQVLAEWLKHGDEIAVRSKMDQGALSAVIDAAIEENQPRLAMEFLEAIPDHRHRIERILEAAVKNRDTDVATAAAAIAARLFVRTGGWGAAVRAAEEADFSDLRAVRHRELQTLLRSSGGAEKVFEATIGELAVSNELAAEVSEKQSPVSEFLSRHFVSRTPFRPRQPSIPVDVVGAAIERAGRIVAALQYYEGLSQDSSVGKDKQEFATQRLVRNLERHAEYFRSIGDTRQAEERKERAQKLREAAGFGNKQFPEYPLIRSVTGKVESPTEWRRGPYRMVLSRVYNRLRIEHSERFETVTIYGEERQLKGDAAFSELAPRAGELVVWRINDWRITARLLAIDGLVKVCIDFEDGPFELELTGGLES